MRLSVRWLALAPVVALTAAFLWQATSGGVSAQGGRRVTIQDNNAPSPAPPLNLFDPRQGRWQFNPTNMEIAQGEQIVFQSPPSNDHAHTVTNLRRTSPGNVVPATFVGGDRFDSGLIQPGSTWTLDTAQLGLGPGNYAFVCRLHPWMNGEFTVR